MQVNMEINGKPAACHVEPDTTLQQLLRERGYASVKCGCDTSSCGLCTVLLDDMPVLSCSVLAARAGGCRVTTLEGVGREADLLGDLLADVGAEQCGFCAPGFMMAVIALKRQMHRPDDETIRAYLAGNLCRCTGYTAQLQVVRKYLEE